MKRSPLRRRTALPRSSGLFRSTPIPATSTKRRRQLGEYRKLRAEFLASRPRCEHPNGCPNPATEIQHRRGRRGERLLDVAWWAASCNGCNADAESATGDALACGWLVRIEGDAA